MDRSRLLTVMSLAVCLSLSAGAATATAGPRNMQARKAVGGSDAVVAHFRTATCKRGKPKASLQYYARSVSTNGDYTLRVLIDDFKGYRQYTLPFGSEADPYVSVNGPEGSYSTLVGPPFLPIAGALKFSARGKTLSLGIVGAFERGLADGVALAGSVDCVTPKKKKKKK